MCVPKLKVAISESPQVHVCFGRPAAFLVEIGYLQLVYPYDTVLGAV